MAQAPITPTLAATPQTVSAMAAPQASAYDTLRGEVDKNKSEFRKNALSRYSQDLGGEGINKYYGEKTTTPGAGGQARISEGYIQQSEQGIEDDYKDRLDDAKRQDEANVQKNKSLDPLKNLQNIQAQRSAEFKTAFPSLAAKRVGEARNDIRKQVAAGIGDVRSSHNRRGLLYSGGRAGAESAIQEAGDQDVLTQQAQINKDLLDQSSALDQGVVDTGMQIADLEKDYNQADESYRNALFEALQKRMNDEDQNLEGIGSDLGSAAGSLVAYGGARKDNKKVT